MLRGSHMFEAANIWRPDPLLGIQAPRQQKCEFRHPQSWLQKKHLQFLLTVGGKSAHVAQDTTEFGALRHLGINIWINAAVERQCEAHPPGLLKLLQNFPTGE